MAQLAASLEASGATRGLSMASVRNWSFAALLCGVLPLAVYLILILDLPYSRLRAALDPPALPSGVQTARLGRAVELLRAADPGEAGYADRRHVAFYEVDDANLIPFAYNVTGTGIVVLNRARLTSPELTAAALSHELFHASHRFGLMDLWLPEETQAYRHTLATTAKLGISIPAVEQYAALLYIAPLSLCVFLVSLVVLWWTRPRLDDLKAFYFPTGAEVRTKKRRWESFGLPV